MYSGSHKYGRGRGGGGGGGGNSKRKSFPPAPHHRSSTPSSTNRLSLGGSGSNSRSRTPSSSTPTPPLTIQAADESFRLVRDEPPSLATIIRLTPDLVDEIKRVEAQGGAARMKFDSNPNNPGNVIEVGGKEYRFTWADEMHCDIYEERQGGEDGNGLLVETGYVWRKLTVQRVLDESTKKHVKMRSLECQTTLKSRKAIVLEPSNPSMKSQMKALAAAEATQWKHKQKELPTKKKNSEVPQGSGSAKPAHRPRLPSTTLAKGRRSTSPLPSPQTQFTSLASPSVGGTPDESRTINGPRITHARPNECSVSPENILSPRVTAMMHEGVPHSHGAGALDSEHFLVTLLKNNPKGMSLKALEKAVGDMSASSGRRMEPILQKIATYEPSGRYLLKPGYEVGTLKSSPEDRDQKQFVPGDNYGGTPAPNSSFAEKSPADYMKEQVPVNNKFQGESNVVEKFDPSAHLTDLFGDDEPPHHSGQAVSSSDSDSDTASGSSGSGTNSPSRSRSRSPAGSASASSSDSEADSSSNSKEGSDVEVDIMSDGDKEPMGLQDTGHGLSSTPMPWSVPEARADGNNFDQDGYASEDVDIENDFLGDNEVQLATASHNHGMPTGTKIVSHDHDEQQNFGGTDEISEQEHGEDKFKHEHSGSILGSQKKSKRGLNVVHMEENTDSVKRFKGRSMVQSSASGQMGSHTLQGQRDSHNLQISNRFNRNDQSNENIGEDRAYNYSLPGKSNVELSQSGGRPPVHSHTTESADRPSKNPVNAHARENIRKQGDKDFIETQDEEGSSNEKTNEKFKESPFSQKPSMRPEPLYKQQSSRSKKSLDTSTRRHSGLLPKDSSKSDIGKSPIEEKRLQRELSDLEMGEFREPVAEEPDLSKKSLERVGSFKQSDAKMGTGSRNGDLNAKSANQSTLDPGNAARKADRLPKRRSPEPYSEDAVRLQNGNQSQPQQSRSGRVEVEALPNTFANQETDVEGYGETQRKSSENAPREDSQQELQSHRGKGHKSRKSKAMGDGDDKRRDISVGRTAKRKRSESSDENASYSKFEKEGPELKGPIKSFPQYKEYVQEYHDKYDSYRSLNKILENYRNEFQKLGLDLENAKGRDMERYYSILAQLRESYRQCGTRHKRLKKVFIVLHEELKHLKQRIKDFAVDYTRD